jgi:serine/threonine-protein kinase
MDFVPGDDLKTLMDNARRKGKTLPLADLFTWADQLADALAYMHRQDPPVVHRDIKPSNLKITPSGLIKLVDFGLVKQMAPEEVTVTVIQGRGTALYTPLEQYGGDTGHTDARSDIYAFGATLYHIVTNQPPLEAKQRFLKPDALVPPRQLNPELTVAAEEAILWAMALHPDDRPQDIQAFREALIEGLGHSYSSAAGQTLTDMGRWLPTEWDRRLAFVIGVLLVVAALASFR